MGVYIDMEMPEKTYAHCMLIKDLDGSVQLHVCTKNSEEISEWEYFDLVPVPPHGDLIDRDALAEDGWVLTKQVMRMGGYAIHELPLKNPTIPVIIPAEKGET